MKAQRFIVIDLIRGLAVLLMIIFHLVFDLHHFRFLKVNFLLHPSWTGFARFIVFLFLLCAGMALALAHKEGIRWRAVKKRFLVLGSWSVVITLVTYLLYPRNFIFFGALHCITLASLAGLLFLGRPKLALGVSVIIILSDLIFKPRLVPLPEWLHVTPVDYVPFYPWVGVLILGIYLESTRFSRIPLESSAWTRPFQFMGRHSLKIYLLHQPILFGIFLMVYRLTR